MATSSDRPPTRSGADVLELAVLGLLADGPTHGYALKQRLSAVLGTFRAFSFGSLYPTLKRLSGAGFVIDQHEPVDVDAVPLTSRRSRVIYVITPEGKERLTDLLADSGPQARSDDGFGVHLAFFARTPSPIRVRILEGRRRRIEEGRENRRSALARAADRLDRYTAELHQLGLDAADREVRWLDQLIAHEREHHAGGPPCTYPGPSDIR